jgi:thiol peroxidase
VLVKELMLLSRSIFVVDSTDTITYIQHVAEITSEPDYAAVLEAAKGPQIATSQLPGDGFCGGY